MMHFLSKILYFLLVFHYAAAANESVVEFTFNATALGHSGLLITWKPITEIRSENTSTKYYFMFKEYRVEENNDEEFKFSDHKSQRIEGKNYEFNETRYTGYYSSGGQFKIHSLNESTLYVIVIQQYGGKFDTTKNGATYATECPVLRRYIVKKRTGSRSTKIPAKPYLDYDNFFKGNDTAELITILRWYPCGRERICTDSQESGTHFGIRVREPYNTKKWVEVEEEEFEYDCMFILFWPGRMYEVVVFSINGAEKTDSDTLEIFIKPNLSVLISWKPPRHVHDVVEGYMVFFPEDGEPRADEEVPMLMHYDTGEPIYRSLKPTKYEQIRIFDLKFKLMYNFIIFPFNTLNKTSYLGLEYRGKVQLQAHNNDLPIARPDFNYKFVEQKGRCDFNFKWLPCGQSHKCENSKPGSNYSFEFSPEPKPEPSFAKIHKEHGIFEGVFDMDKEYYVRLTSSIGKNVSEPVIKYFKDCHEIKKHTSRGTGEL